MIIKKHIEDMQLEDFLSLEYNRILYEDFNKGLKDYLNESALSLFKYIYRDIVDFMNGYKDFPYEINSILSSRYNKECVFDKKLILICIIHDTLSNLTSLNIYSATESKYIVQDDEYFHEEFSCFKFFFECSNDLNRFSGYDGLQHFMDENARYRRLPKFCVDYESIKTVKQFVSYIGTGTDCKKRHTQNSLKELFDDPLKYDQVLDKLIQNEIIIYNDNSFRINTVQLEENKLSLLRSICAFGFLLKTKGYLKTKTQDTSITKALSNFFEIDVSKGAYSRAKEQCFLFTDKADDYFNIFYLL